MATSIECPHRLQVNQDWKSHFDFSPLSCSACSLFLLNPQKARKNGRDGYSSRKAKILNSAVISVVKSHCSICTFLKHFTAGLLPMNYNMASLHSHDYLKNFLLIEMSLHYVTKGKWMGYVNGRIRERNSWILYGEMQNGWTALLKA